MQHDFQIRILFMSMMAALLLVAAAGAHAAEPVVRAVIFYSPVCGHCQKVISEDFPPLFEKHGSQLQIIGVNTADAAGGALFDAACDMCNIPPESRGVPLLVVADVCLVGSLDIPTQLPGLVEQYLDAGGVEWPAIPGLAEAIAQAQASATATPAASAAPPGPVDPTPAPTLPPSPTQPVPTPGILMAGGESDGFRARFDRDPVGNGLSVVVLCGMLAALGWVIAQRPWRALRRRILASGRSQDLPDAHPATWTMNRAIPLLSLIGLGIAGYLGYVETLQVEAVCGPVGDCNSVQQSEFALVLGLIPVGVMGVFGYLAILAAWAFHRFSPGRIGQWAGLALWALAVAGTLFSAYLTFLEPFVIGATCAWCLSSAVIMTLLLLITTASLREVPPRPMRSGAPGEAW